MRPKLARFGSISQLSFALSAFPSFPFLEYTSPFPSPQLEIHELLSQRHCLSRTSPNMAAKSQSINGSESEFEFIETPKAATPTFEKFEDCGVRTTSVSSPHTPCPPRQLFKPRKLQLTSANTAQSLLPSRMLPSPPTALAVTGFPTPSSSPSSSSSPSTCPGKSGAA
jgi:hypothetical protein